MTVNYNMYKKVRDMSWQFLIDYNICSLPVKLIPVCRQKGISVMRYTGTDYFSPEERGIVYYKDGSYNILLNGSDSIQVQRYTVAHEIGHIYLNHLKTENIHTRISGTRAEPRPPKEYQAERFAMGILAPACVIHELGLHTAKEIAELCDISVEDASYRAERMRILYKRGKFLTSELEQKAFEQFKPFIDEMKQKMAEAQNDR